MIPLERTSQDLGRSTILIMKIQKGGPQIKIIWGENYSSEFPGRDGQFMGWLACEVLLCLMKNFQFLLYKITFYNFLLDVD